MGTRHSNLALVVPGSRRDLSAPPAPNRREYERLAARELDWLNLVRLKYGPAVSLLDLSAGGAQIEASGRLKPGSSVVIEIAGQDCEFAVASQIALPGVAHRAAHGLSGRARTPVDKPTNNLRIYVVSSAVARVRFR